MPRTPNEKRKSTGRRKIEIKRLENKANRQVTFSKRRVGLMNKASELCIRCGAEVAILTTSPEGHRIYAFGHPSPDAVINRYLSGGLRMEPPAEYPPVHEYNRKYEEVVKELEAEKAKEATLEQPTVVSSGDFLWELPIENMGLEELEQYMESMEEMRKRLIKLRTSELIAEAYWSLS